MNPRIGPKHSLVTNPTGQLAARDTSQEMRSRRRCLKTHKCHTGYCRSGTEAQRHEQQQTSHLVLAGQTAAEYSAAALCWLAVASLACCGPDPAASAALLVVRARKLMNEPHTAH